VGSVALLEDIVSMHPDLHGLHLRESQQAADALDDRLPIQEPLGSRSTVTTPAGYRLPESPVATSQSGSAYRISVLRERSVRVVEWR
jgi:hypothetical protein